jgi:4-aminobutyrate aminotransferase-like enzyme
MFNFSLTPKNVPLLKTKHREIRTAIPNPATLEVIQECMRFEPSSMNDQLPVVWDRAEGYQVFDKSGNCWLDFTSTIFVANVGHSHPKVIQAIRRTVDKKLINAYYYQTEERARLVKKLEEISPAGLDKVLLLSTGSEATEAAIKMTRKHGGKISPKKTVIVGFEGSFHGKTMGSQTLGGKPAGKEWIGFHHPEIVHLPYPYPWVLEKMNMNGKEFFHFGLKKLEEAGVCLSNIAGFFAEPYQGWCAVFFPKDFMQELRAWSSANNALLGFDEIQAGFGRTGKMFGFEHFDVIPDLFWCGKAISASIPVSAVIGKGEIVDVDPSFNSTHGGNPIGAAASFAAISVLQDEHLVDAAARKGALIKDELERWRKEVPDYIGDIYGEGVVWGVFVRNPITGELDSDLVDRVIERAMEKGLLSIRTCCGTIKLGPPIITPDDALIEGIEILKESLKEITSA